MKIGEYTHYCNFLCKECGKHLKGKELALPSCPSCGYTPDDGLNTCNPIVITKTKITSIWKFWMATYKHEANELSLLLADDDLNAK